MGAWVRYSTHRGCGVPGVGLCSTRTGVELGTCRCAEVPRALGNFLCKGAVTSLSPCPLPPHTKDAVRVSRRVWRDSIILLRRAPRICAQAPLGTNEIARMDFESAIKGERCGRMTGMRILSQCKRSWVLFPGCLSFHFARLAGRTVTPIARQLSLNEELAT